jgi:hypothetical protein
VRGGAAVLEEPRRGARVCGAFFFLLPPTGNQNPRSSVGRDWTWAWPICSAGSRVSSLPNI